MGLRMFRYFFCSGLHEVCVPHHVIKTGYLVTQPYVYTTVCLMLCSISKNSQCLKSPLIFLFFSSSLIRFSLIRFFLIRFSLIRFSRYKIFFKSFCVLFQISRKKISCRTLSSRTLSSRTSSSRTLSSHTLSSCTLSSRCFEQLHFEQFLKKF